MSTFRWFSKKTEHEASPGHQPRGGEAISMNDEELAAQYATAMQKLRPHIHPADDGTFALDVKSGEALDIDPVTFADLKRSLEQTNELIRRGEIDREAVLAAK
jgi:hypothetical protein